MMRSVAAAAFAALFAVPAAQAATWSPELQSIIDKAKAEGELQISTAPNVLGGADGAKAVEAGLASMFGVKAPVVWTPAPAMAQLAAKIYEEYRAGGKSSTDLISVSAIQAVPYLDKGLFMSVDWVKLMPERITPDIVEGGGQALRLDATFPAILYNTHLAQWVKDIRVMDDLLKPEYKEKFATTSFLGGFDALAAKDGWGIEKTTDYVRKLAPQVSGLMRCNSEDRIASGEAPAIALDCVGGAQYTARFRDAHILDSHIVRDAAQRRYYYFFIPSNAKHPNAAILYGLYLSSPEGQRDVMLNLDGNDLDSYPESTNAKRLKALQADGVKFLDVDIAWWAKQQSPELLAALANMVKIIEQKK
jgi:ABC-type Fe3+ transport system substrate-binding protein